MDMLNPSFNFREYAGDIHFMQQLQREYRFLVEVFQEDENGARTLLRIEAPSL
jgi:hypothetical protein